MWKMVFWLLPQGQIESAIVIACRLLAAMWAPIAKTSACTQAKQSSSSDFNQAQLTRSAFWVCVISTVDVKMYINAQLCS